MPVSKSDQASFDEIKAVTDALSIYIESAKPGDGARIRTVFADHAHIIGTIGGTFYDMDADTFGEAVQSGGESPDVEHQIAWIDISGPAAAAKVEFVNWGGNRFTDFFVLFKNEGVWKISGKVYDTHSGT